MTSEHFLGIVTNTILNGHQRYISLVVSEEMPAKDELLQLVKRTIDTIVGAAGEVPVAERAEALTKAVHIIVNLSFARIGSVLESQFHTAEHRQPPSPNQ